MTTRKKASDSDQSRHLAQETTGITFSKGLPNSSKPSLQVATSTLIVLEEYVRHYFAQEESLLAEEEQAYFSEIRESGQKPPEIGQVLQHATQNLQAIGTD